MLAGKISALKYFPNCFWDSAETSSPQLTFPGDNTQGSGVVGRGADTFIPM